MAELNEAGLIHGEALTVTGTAVSENVAGAAVIDPSVIRPLDNPYSSKEAFNFFLATLLQKARCAKLLQLTLKCMFIGTVTCL